MRGGVGEPEKFLQGENLTFSHKLTKPVSKVNKQFYHPIPPANRDMQLGNNDCNGKSASTICARVIETSYAPRNNFKF